MIFEILVCVVFNSLAGILLTVEPTPEMVTFAVVLCIPWLGCDTLTTAEPLVVLSGFADNVLEGTASLTKVTVPVFVVSKEARLSLNFKSCS